MTGYLFVIVRPVMSNSVRVAERHNRSFAEKILTCGEIFQTTLHFYFNLELMPGVSLLAASPLTPPTPLTLPTPPASPTPTTQP